MVSDDKVFSAYAVPLAGIVSAAILGVAVIENFHIVNAGPLTAQSAR